MKMIRAIIRPEKEEDVIKGLELAGCPSLTKMDVFGRGKQKGIQVGNAVYGILAMARFLFHRLSLWLLFAQENLGFNKSLNRMNWLRQIENHDPTETKTEFRNILFIAGFA